MNLKNILVRWTSFLNKKIKKAKKQNLNDQVYEELKHLETTKLKTHYWYWLHRNWNQWYSKISFAMQLTIGLIE
jgi:hypothetical protein